MYLTIYLPIEPVGGSNERPCSCGHADSLRNFSLTRQSKIVAEAAKILKSSVHCWSYSIWQRGNKKIPALAHPTFTRTSYVVEDIAVLPETSPFV